MRKPERPNILMIMADQLRHDWLGCAGADHVSTPNINGIAERGVRFTQCTTPSPICAPARISLASGLMPHRLGSVDNSAYLPISIPTYYQRLRDYGYHVGCVGKLDLAKSDRYNGMSGARPRTFGWGFTHPVEAEGKMHAGNSATPIGPYTKWLDDRGLLQKFHEDYSVTRPKLPWFEAQTLDSALPTEAFEDVWIGRRAEQWLEEIDGDFPWHLLVSFVGPHNPFDPPTEYADRYRGEAMPKPIADDLKDKPLWIQNRAAQNPGTDEQHAIARRQYSAATTAIDDAVGGVLRALEARGWLETRTSLLPGITANFSATTNSTPNTQRTKHRCACRLSSRDRTSTVGKRPTRLWNWRTSIRRCATLRECRRWRISTAAACLASCTIRHESTVERPSRRRETIARFEPASGSTSRASTISRSCTISPPIRTRRRTSSRNARKLRKISGNDSTRGWSKGNTCVADRDKKARDTHVPRAFLIYPYSVDQKLRSWNPTPN
ncbi:MAG TPA: hypothetical protein ENN56_00155 [Firmicutes bacterium]|nr:hypothetical protein [Bacillota bacterium]